MMRSSLTAAVCVSSVSITMPSRSTVMRSATVSTSFILCEMMIEAIPSAFNSIKSFSSRSESLSLRLDVGSSRISNFTFLFSAFAISTSCCLPVPRWVMSVLGCSLRPTLARKFFGALESCKTIDDATARDFVAEKNVLGNRQQRHEGSS